MIMPVEGDSESDRYKKLFQNMQTNRTRDNHRREMEELYYGDVEGTLSQFTQQQLKVIQQKYDIPISTKANYAIIEQMLSFLTGAKPTMRFITNNEKDQQWTYLFEKLHRNVWAESNGDSAMESALRDMLVVGSGFLRVRKEDFLHDTTFGIVYEHVPWIDVFVDPRSTKKDFSDAEYIIVARPIPRQMVKKIYDVDIDDEDYEDVDRVLLTENYTAPTQDYLTLDGKQSRHLWVKEFYEAVNHHIYISPDGYTSLKRPTPTEIPNPDYQKLQEAAKGIEGMLQEKGAMHDQMAQTMPANMGMPTGEGSPAGDMEGLQQELANIEQVMAQVPPTIPAHSMTLDNGEVVTVKEYKHIKKRRIKRVLQVGRRILEKEILNTEVYPIVHFCNSHMRSPNKTYGVNHYIKDAVKAMNKLWAQTIYDLQLSGTGRWIAPEQSVQKPEDFERKMAMPGGLVTYTADPQLPDGGAPTYIPGNQPNQGIMQLVMSIQQLAENITGIHGVVQGNQMGAPDSMGGMHSLQSFGTQRIKLMTRALEHPLSQLAEASVTYLQKYCPIEELRKHMDPDGDGLEEQFFNLNLDNKFKARVQLASSLPTSRQMASVLLTTLAGQMADPQAQQLISQYAMKFLEIQEADEIAEKMDAVKSLQSQTESAQQEIEELKGKIKQMENSLAQKEIELNVQKKMVEIEKTAAVGMNSIENAAVTAEQQIEEPQQGVPF